MLNIPELALANPLLPTTDYNAITDNQAKNIAVAFEEYQAKLDNSTLKKLYINAKPLAKLNSGTYQSLQKMSIHEMTNQAYKFNLKMKGKPLNLRKIAVMPTLHHFNFPLFAVPSVKEVLSQLPQCLQNRNIFFHTTFPRLLAAMPLPESIEEYEKTGQDKINNLVQPSVLMEKNLHVAETTFFELATSDLQ